MTDVELKDMRYRFRIRFDGFPDIVGQDEYDDKKRCIADCLAMIRKVKEMFPVLGKAYRGWKCHGYPVSGPEPEWR